MTKEFKYRNNDMFWNKVKKGIHPICSKWILFLIISAILIDGVYLTLDYMTNTDEFSSIAVPAYLSGKNWSDLCSNLDFHGYGSVILLSPFFQFLKTGVEIYKLCQVECLVFRIICMLLTFYIVHVFGGIEERESFFITVICNFSVISPEDGVALSAMTEVPLSLILLIVCYLILKIDEKQLRYDIFLGVVLAISMVVHSRAIVVIGATVIVLLTYCVINKKITKNAIVFVLALAGCVYMVSLCDAEIQRVVYRLAEGEQLDTNTFTLASTRTIPYLAKLFDVELLKTICITFLSLLGSYTVYTFGFIWIVLISNIWYLISEVKNKFGKRDYKIDVFWYVVLFGVVSWLGMNVAISISSTGSVLAENYRWLTYIRYAKPFTWILSMTGMTILYKRNGTKQMILFVSFVLSILVIELFLRVTVPILKDSGYGLGYSAFNRIFYEGQDIESFFLVYGRIAILVLLIFCLNGDKIIRSMIVYMLLSLIVFGQNYNYSKERDNVMGKLTNATTALISSDEFESNVEIYYTGSNRFTMYLRMALPEQNMYYISNLSEVEEGVLERGIIIVDSIDEQMQNMNCYTIMLDDNEFVLTDNSEIKENIENIMKNGVFEQ